MPSTGHDALIEIEIGTIHKGMIDPEIPTEVIQTGSVVAVIAAVLCIFTSRPEDRKIRLWPKTARGWVGYWFRMLYLVVITALVSAPLIPSRYRNPLGGIACFAGFPLFCSSIAFWNTDRCFCIGGLCLSLISLLLGLTPTVNI